MKRLQGRDNTDARIDEPVIRTGDRAKLRFRFMYRSEYIKEGSRFIFREGRTKGLGRVTAIHPLFQ